MGNNGNGRHGTHWVGVDLGGTKIMALVFDESFEILGRKRKKTKAYEGAESGLGRIEKTIRSALEAASVSPEQVAGIGIGVPGALNLEKGVLVDSPNLGWHDLAVSRELKKRFGVKATMLNDVDAGVYGEYASGAAKGARCVVGVFPGTGIGGGCVYEGRLITGGEHSCMEIGHLPVVVDGARCGCGRRGCLETVASRLAISSMAAVAAYRGEAPTLLEAAGCDISNIRSGALAKAVAAGDTIVERIIRDAAAWLGIGIASAVNLLAPDIVLLGGGLTEAMPQIYREEVGAALAEHIMPAYEGTYRIEIAALGDDAVALGAAAWARRNREEKG